jgi:site-specific recombinase XerD
MAREAQAAGIPASGRSRRQTSASNLVEHGAEVVTIRDSVGHRPIASSAREAQVSSQKMKQAYRRTMQNILTQGQV